MGKLDLVIMNYNTQYASWVSLQTEQFHKCVHLFMYAQ